MEYLLLILGLVVLLYSGDLLVKAGVEIARYFKISPLVSGITIVALGTSAPEFFVSVSAAFKGSSDIAMGNVVGSNIANIALVLGVTSMILAIPVLRKTLQFDWGVMMGASVLLYIFAFGGALSFWEGFVMTVFLAVYLFMSVYRSRKELKVSDEQIPKPTSSPVRVAATLVLASVGLYFGADLLVDNAIIIATDFGISERVVAISVVALGTSLPELATSVIAACRKELDISVGNIIGSNIFNILGVLGLTSMIKKVNIAESIMNFDIIAMLIVSLLLFVLIMLPKRYILSKWKGVLLMLFYAAYIYSVFI